MNSELEFVQWVQSQEWLQNDWTVFFLLLAVVVLNFRWCRRTF